MRKELGKWLLDIAKYLVTAILLSSVFGDIEEKWVIYLIVIISSALTLCGGLWLIKDKKNNNKKEE